VFYKIRSCNFWQRSEKPNPVKSSLVLISQLGSSGSRESILEVLYSWLGVKQREFSEIFRTFNKVHVREQLVLFRLQTDRW